MQPYTDIKCQLKTKQVLFRQKPLLCAYRSNNVYLWTTCRPYIHGYDGSYRCREAYRVYHKSTFISLNNLHFVGLALGILLWAAKMSLTFLSYSRISSVFRLLLYYSHLCLTALCYCKMFALWSLSAMLLLLLKSCTNNYKRFGYVLVIVAALRGPWWPVWDCPLWALLELHP